MTLAVTGTALSRGVALGSAHLIFRDLPDVHEETIADEDIEKEVRRYRSALRRTRKQLKVVLEQIPPDTPTDIEGFIETHQMMLNDAPLADGPVRFIRERKINAEWALKQQRDKLLSIFADMNDPYLSAREDDVNQVVRRLMATLLRGDEDAQPKVTAPVVGRVIVADDLSASDVALYSRLGARGFVTEHGSPLSHSAILARSLHTPSVAGVANARSLLLEHDDLVVDGERGVVVANPDRRSRQHFTERHKRLQRHFTGLSKYKGKRAVTLDGETISVEANIERLDDIKLVREAGASGIGLFRTEFLFMNRSELPDEEEQLATYVEVVKAFPRKPVTLRTLDLGADKHVEGAGAVATNPALGLRAVRYCLSDPSMFRTQLRAMLRASRYGRLRIMIPMLTNASEIFQVRNIIRALRRDLEREGHKVAREIPLGGMIEVPAAAIAAPLFAKYLDFLSIGTNDLTQYTLAIDRVDDSVSYLYDPLHPSLLKLVQIIIDGGRRHDKPVSMCGEMAGDTRYIRLLMALGLRDFSMHPAKLLEAKRAVAGTRLADLERYTHRIQRTTNPRKLNELVREMNR